ncbi:MAG TPA: hypothetical protein VED59_02580, partial [Acidimicrobiales bacterium]|nr:hypothetical protein [Acidimicrobiales bacterium]
RLGVSVLKVVATIEIPTSHQGAARPEVKNSVVLELARRTKKIAGRNEMPTEMATMVQSSAVRCMVALKMGRRMVASQPPGTGSRPFRGTEFAIPVASAPFS